MLNELEVASIKLNGFQSFMTKQVRFLAKFLWPFSNAEVILKLLLQIQVSNRLAAKELGNLKTFDVLQIYK